MVTRSQISAIREKYEKSTLVKRDIASEVGNALGLSDVKALEATHAVLDSITAILASGKKIEIRGFGKWEVLHMSERMGRNPRTMEEVPIPEHHTVKWHVSPILKKIVTKSLGLTLP